ncbi:hypothetical protein B0T14DRAFT_88226 [Immersiella caudata]|uniref:C2H2-type domain-containing protein n=1 Tax=Immersiella caudata TaxID=314043 RepID=A0AA39X233_9PEZI|nr:hypothetical protein B0T14DRAFT_88226 [Immersiella caudata]
MDDPQCPAPAIKTGQEAVGMQATTTTTPTPSGNPKPLDLEPPTPNPEALSDKASPAMPIPIPAASQKKSVEIDMDAAPEQGVERHDTLDSFRSHFASRRTGTTFSALSMNTDITEVTDYATIHDEVDDQHASATRSLCRVDSFPSRPPTRTTSFNIVDDEAMGPSRNSPPSDIRPLTHPEVLRLREMSTPRSSNRHGRGNGPPISLPIRQKGSEGSPAAPRSGLGREDTVTGPSNPHSIPEVDEEDDEEVPTTAVDTRRHSNVVEWAQSDPEDWATDSSQRPDENLIQDVCDRTLKQVFGVELHDLVDTGAAPEAFRAVSYCLDELSRIISASNLASFGIPVNEYGRGGGDQGHAPLLPAGGGSDQNSHGYNGNGGRRTNKRGASDEGDSPEHNESNDGDGMGGNGQGGKRAKTDSTEDQRLSCPFRKRNPVKFNVRDHQNCAVQSFPDVSQLKRHVKFFHKQKAVSPFDCPRCKRNMGAKEALQEHLAVSNDSICTFQETPLSQNPEDGINAKIEDLLNGRRANSKVDTWEILWQTLFPNSPQEAIPDPTFVPPIELDEVHADFRSDNWRHELTRRISEEEMSAAGSDDDVQGHIERIVKICEAYIEEVFTVCREDKLDNLPCQTRRKRVQKGKGRGQKDPSRLDIPTTGAAQLGFPNASDDPGSASDIDTPRSNHSTWATYGTQPGMSTAHVSPALGSLTNGFAGFDVSGMGVSAANNQAVLTQPDLSFGYLNQPQPHHHRQPSEDSGVGFERTIAFGNNGMHQRHAFTHAQMPFQNANYAPQIMQSNGGGRGHGRFPVPAAMPIQTSMPLSMPGASPTGIDSTLLPFSSPLDQGEYGYPPNSGLNMNNGNHM